MGGGGADRGIRAWRQVYRAVEHRTAKSACADRLITEFPRAIEDFANAFVALQAKRHLADYDPVARFVKFEVAQDIATAKQVIVEFAKAPIKDRRAFCAFVLFRRRA